MYIKMEDYQLAKGMDWTWRRPSRLYVMVFVGGLGEYLKVWAASSSGEGLWIVLGSFVFVFVCQPLLSKAENGKKITSHESTEIDTPSNKLSENMPDKDLFEKKLTRQESKKALQRINFMRTNYVRKETSGVSPSIKSNSPVEKKKHSSKGLFYVRKGSPLLQKSLSPDNKFVLKTEVSNEFTKKLSNKNILSTTRNNLKDVLPSLTSPKDRKMFKDNIFSSSLSPKTKDLAASAIKKPNNPINNIPILPLKKIEVGHVSSKNSSKVLKVNKSPTQKHIDFGGLKISPKNILKK